MTNDNAPAQWRDPNSSCAQNLCIDGKAHRPEVYQSWTETYGLGGSAVQMTTYRCSKCGVIQ